MKITTMKNQIHYYYKCQLHVTCNDSTSVHPSWLLDLMDICINYRPRGTRSPVAKL